MTKPVTPTDGAWFDLEALAADLRQEQAYARVGHAARTLVRTSDLRVVLVVLKAGKTIAEHHASVTASVQTLTGRVTLQLPKRSADVAAGQLLVLGPELAHDVQAREDSTFLLTLGWPSPQADTRS